ncbi:COMM domain-containing protein 9 isoform X2 [Vanacampus margaritifer]
MSQLAAVSFDPKTGPAPSKDFVKDMCVHVVHVAPSPIWTEKAATALAVPEAQIAQLARSLRALLALVVFHNLSSAQQIVRLFPDGFHASLKNLLAKILLDNRSAPLDTPTSPPSAMSSCSDDVIRVLGLCFREAWRTDAVGGQTSLPQLKAVDWRVDVVSSSDALRRMCVPACLVHFETEDVVGEDCVSVATVELSRESLDTMLDGLGRIRDQLALVAGK